MKRKIVLGLVGLLLAPRLFATDFAAARKVAPIYTFTEVSAGDSLDRDLLTWMKTTQNANAGRWKTFYQRLLPAEAPVKTLPVSPRLRGTLSGFFDRAKSIFSPKAAAPVALKPGLVSLDGAFSKALKLQVERDNARLLASLPADGVVDVARMAPQVAAAAQILNARWMLRSIPFGVYMDGSFYDGILKDFPLTKTFKDSPDTAGLDDLNKIFMQIPCADLGRLGKNLNEEIVRLRGDLAGKEIIFRSLYNGLLRSLVVLSDDLAQCQIQPPDFWGYAAADGTSTLLERLSGTPDFSLKSLWLTDPKSLRLRKFTSEDLPGHDVAGFLNGAFRHLTPGMASCSATEKIFGGSADLSCPSCKGSASPSADSATSFLARTDGLKGASAAPSSWGECRNSAHGGGAGLGGLGSCYGSSALFSNLSGQQLSCTRNGFQMNVDSGAFPGGGPFCRTSLVGGDVLGRAVPHDDERIRGLDRERHRPDLAGDMSQSLGDGGVSATEADVASLIDAIIGQFQSGERTVSQADLPGDQTVRVTSDGDAVVDTDMSLRDGCYVAATAIANTIIAMSSTDVAGDTRSYDSGSTMNRLYHYHEGDEDKDKTPTAPVASGGTATLCEAGEGCGSGNCGMVPAVIQKFTDCLFGSDPTLSLPDPCRFGMCLDEPGAGSFASQCAPSLDFNDGCGLVDCASEGALGLASSDMSRCCGAGAASTSGPTQGSGLTRSGAHLPGGSSEIPGWSPDGGELPTGGVGGGLGPQNPPDASK